jgi:hypothetical protein
MLSGILSPVRSISRNIIATVCLPPLLTALSGSCLAQPAYLIDSLWIGVNAAPSGSGETLQIIRSGAQVDVESITEGWAKIETSVGVVGWIDASYLTEELPLGLELKKITQAYKNNNDAIDQASSRLQELEHLAQPLIDANGLTYMRLTLTALLIGATGLGFGVGVSWRNHRLRKKFGGLLP